MQKLLSVLALLISLLVPSLASAQGNLGSHYREMVLNFNSASVEIQYIAIPRVGWPVRVQISATGSNGDVFLVTSFTVTDSPVAGYNPVMTIPSTPVLVGNFVAPTCTFPGYPVAAIECVILPHVSVGVTETSMPQPHKLFVRANVSGDPSQFRITMWYLCSADRSFRAVFPW